MLDLAAQSPQETPRWLYRSAGIATLVLALWAFRGLLGYDPYLQVSRGTSELEDWFFHRSGSSAPLIFGVSCCFLLTRLGRLKQAFDRPGPSGGRGWLLLLPASLIYCWAIYVSAQDLLLIALILTTLGAGLWLGGRTARDTLLSPVLFLLLLIPWPAALINQIIFPMQLATAQATTAVLNAFGLPASVSGELIFASTGVFRVIESCAGLRMVDALIMAACVYASLYYRSRLQVAILLFCAPVIALIANLARVLSLVLNPLSTFAEIHVAQGIVVTVLGVLMLAGVDRLLESWLPSPKSDLSDRGAAGLTDIAATQMPSRWVRIASLSLIFGFLVLASHTIRPWQSQHELWIAP
ncbi:MAG: exosortase/archaeosortase family protein, partial [Polyangiaceae bacterium]